MKRTLHFFPVLALLFFIGSCRKSTNESPSSSPKLASLDSIAAALHLNNTDSLMQTPYPLNGISGCFPAPLYGDSILYPQPANGSDDIVGVVNDPGPGHYFSWPAGLVLDSATGAIDLSKSQSGERYAIGYVKAGTEDTCMTMLIIGGADYMDSVYVLADGAGIAAPYFNANAYLPSDCSGPGNSNHCRFDVTGSATDQKVVIDKFTGEIDLAKTLSGNSGLAGAFGPAPVNGSTITTTIYYTLSKGSNNATQSINVAIAYYDSKSLINGGIINALRARLENILSSNLISYTYNPRPPLIVIVRR